MDLVLLDNLRVIEKISSDLLYADAHYQMICEGIMKKYNFDLSALQIIRREDKIIETVAGAGLATAWAGRVGHYLTKDKGLMDIQVSVFYSKNVEIINGRDPRKRLDEWVFGYYNHECLSRAFIPIIIVRDSSGKVLKGWYNHNLLKKSKRDGDCKTLVLRIPRNAEVIGTIEVGYNKEKQREINQDEALLVFKDISMKALEIWKRQLGFVFETILHQAKEISKTNSANLYYSRDEDEKQGYFYQYGVGLGATLVKKFTPRKKGLGLRAIQNKKTQFSPDIGSGESIDDFKRNHSDIFSRGVCAISVTPFFIRENDSEKEGLLYLHFKEMRNPSKLEIKSVEHFLNRTKNILERTATLVAAKDRGRRLANLLAMFRALIEDKGNKVILEQIASWTLNIFSADVVTIYEYDSEKSQFLTPPHTAGRIISIKKMAQDIDRYDVPMKLLDEMGKDGYKNTVLYVTDGKSCPLLYRTDKKSSRGDPLPFFKREKMVSVIAMVLVVDGQPVGTMFINYRRKRNFEKSMLEKELVEALSPVVAFVLQKKRQFRDKVKHGIKLIIKEDTPPNLALFEKGGLFEGVKIIMLKDNYFFGHKYDKQRLQDLRKAVDEVFKRIKPPLLPYTPDQIIGSELLLKRISVMIASTLFCLFEMPDTMNRNVYLEVGLAIGMKRPLMFIKHSNAKMSSLLEGLFYIDFNSYSEIIQVFSEGVTIQIGKVSDVYFSRPIQKDCRLCITNYDISGKFENSEPVFNPEDFKTAVKKACNTVCLSVSTIYDYDPGEQRKGVLDRAILAIQAATVCVFSIDERMSGDNFLSLGVALALGKRCILVKQKDCRVPSDLKGLKYVEFDYYEQLSIELSQRLKDVLNK